jgi:hypothetical protein
MKDKSQIPPSEKQLKYCYDILKRVETCEADEHGQPLFELSMENADKFIKKHRRQPWGNEGHETSAGDWGGIPNH